MTQHREAGLSKKICEGARCAPKKAQSLKKRSVSRVT